MAQEDLKWGAMQFRDSRKRQAYALYNAYYDGDHRLAFATEKFRSTFGTLFKEFAENFCPAVVDSMADRLKIAGFKTSQAEVVTEEIPSPMEGVPPRTKVKTEDPLGRIVQEIFERNAGPTLSDEVHEQAIKC